MGCCVELFDMPIHIRLYGEKDVRLLPMQNISFLKLKMPLKLMLNFGFLIPVRKKTRLNTNGLCTNRNVFKFADL